MADSSPLRVVFLPIAVEYFCPECGRMLLNNRRTLTDRRTEVECTACHISWRVKVPLVQAEEVSRTSKAVSRG